MYYYGWSVKLKDDPTAQTIVFVGRESNRDSTNYIVKLLKEKEISLDQIELDLVSLDHGNQNEDE